jgi:phosphatidylethanolamine/phosphatidyl-N-methylethanolamine N-methyltransferase
MNLDSVQRTYDVYAGIYDLVCGWAFSPGRKEAARLLDLKPGARILEVGVGTGASLGHYPSDTRITGIDISEPMLAEARKRVDQNDWRHIDSLQVMDAQDMRFEDNSFDAVVAMHIATVVPDPARFVAEMRRVCKPGGEILIVTYFDQRETFVGRVAALLAPILGRLLGFRARISYDAFISTTGLKVRRRHYVNLFNLWSVLEVRNDKPVALSGLGSHAEPELTGLYQSECV